MLIQASRTRSSVGRTARPFGALILRPRQRPATIRKRREPRAGRREAEPRDAGCGMWDALVARSLPTESNVGDAGLKIALAAIVVSLQPERDIDAGSRLQMNGAINQPPAECFERAGTGVERDLQTICSNG